MACFSVLRYHILWQVWLVWLRFKINICLFLFLHAYFNSDHRSAFVALFGLELSLSFFCKQVMKCERNFSQCVGLPLQKECLGKVQSAVYGLFLITESRKAGWQFKVFVSHACHVSYYFCKFCYDVHYTSQPSCARLHNIHKYGTVEAFVV